MKIRQVHHNFIYPFNTLLMKRLEVTMEALATNDLATVTTTTTTTTTTESGGWSISCCSCCCCC